MAFPQPDRFDGFLELLCRSGLAPENELNRLVECYRSEFLAVSRLPNTDTALRSFLAASGVLTTWQCTKLREGRYKGFFIDKWVFHDRVSDDPNARIYFARNVHDGTHALLKVIPTDGPQRVRFEIVRQFD